MANLILSYIMKKIFIAGSIILNLALIVILAITLNKLWQQEKTLEDTRGELEQTKDQINNITLENQRLLARLSELNKELSAVKDSLATAQQPLATTKDITPPGESKAGKFLEALVSGASVDERVRKMRELGKMLAKTMKAQRGETEFTPEMMRQMGEMMKLMSEFGPEMEAMMKNREDILLLPETREFIVNMLAGMLEESGKPLSQGQITQFESALTRLAEFDKNIAQGAQTPTEKAIARLQNADVLNALNKELLTIFTEEQQEVLSQGDMDIRGELLSPKLTNVGSTVLENFKNPNEVSKYVLDDWSKSVGASAEQKDSLKPVAEAYTKDYTELRQRMETTYDKNIMDYYLERNKPAETTKQGEYYRERDKLFQTNPDYSRAKTAMDIEFLKLRSNYHKQVAETVGSEKGAGFLKSEPYIYHFPNVE